MSFELPSTPERLRTPEAAPAPPPGTGAGGARAWLTLIGVGADGADGLSANARQAIESAPLVVGSERQLGLVSPLLHGETWTWSPFGAVLERVRARRGLPTCVLGTGDPFFFGIGSVLAAELPPAEFVCHPAPSSLSLAASRLGWPLQDTDVVSLHGRELHTIVRYLNPGRRVLALSWDRATPAELAPLLVERGFGASRLSVLEDLGGPAERIRTCLASAFTLDAIQDLNLIALEVSGAPEARIIPQCAGLPDDFFEHDGQLTKRDVRAITLAALAPTPGARLWDVGAGSGSIGIEWLLCHRACRAIAIERDGARVERIQRNARTLGVPELEVVHGAAPHALRGLPVPNAVFIGGGAGDPALIEQCYAALAPRGRLVVNAVSLETEAALIRAHAERGGELRRIAIESAVPIGSMSGWRAAFPVVQWRLEKR